MALAVRYAATKKIYEQDPLPGLVLGRAKDAVQWYTNFAQDKHIDPDHRLYCANLILNRGWGKPKKVPHKQEILDLFSQMIAKKPDQEYVRRMSELPPKDDQVIQFPSRKSDEVRGDLYPSPQTVGSEPAQRRVIHDIRAYARESAAEMMGVIKEIANDQAVDPSIRLKAADSWLDRAYGKPSQEIVGAGGAPLIPETHVYNAIESLSPDKRLVFRHIVQEILVPQEQLEGNVEDE